MNLLGVGERRLVAHQTGDQSAPLGQQEREVPHYREVGRHREVPAGLQPLVPESRRELPLVVVQPVADGRFQRGAVGCQLRGIRRSRDDRGGMELEAPHPPLVEARQEGRTHLRLGAGQLVDEQPPLGKEEIVHPLHRHHPAEAGRGVVVWDATDVLGGVLRRNENVGDVADVRRHRFDERVLGDTDATPGNRRDTCLAGDEVRNVWTDHGTTLRKKSERTTGRNVRPATKPLPAPHC